MREILINSHFPLYFHGMVLMHECSLTRLKFVFSLSYVIMESGNLVLASKDNTLFGMSMEYM
jgi:hypothetical protein